MLTRVYIDNFRSFVNFEYKPERKQLLLGPNGSGKSSLLAAILYLKQFLKGDDNPFTQTTRTRWQDRPLQVIELEALLDREKYEYRVEIRCAPKTRQMSVSLESLKVSGKAVFEFLNGKIHFFQDDVGPTALPMEITKSALHLAQLSNPRVRRFFEWIQSIHCFRIDAYPQAMDEVADREEQQPDEELTNLAGWYRHLVQGFPDENIKFLDSLKTAMAGFQALRFSSEEDGLRKLRASLATPDKQRVNYSIAELSEGQRCLIALYMILHFLLCKGRTVFIDEPDNFVALREIQPWLQAAETAVEDHNGQLILISHHPEILNQWASSYGLQFFREENGHVRAEKFRPDPEGNLQPSELISRGWEHE